MLLISDIAITYNETIPAVQHVSLNVPPGQVVALLGANGAGKTTIFRAITGLLRLHRAALSRGTITFEGERIDGLNTTQIVQRGIAQVLEGRRLFADLTVDENLKAGAYVNRDSAAVRRAYDRVMDLFPKLQALRKTAAGYLSGGEQQMVAIGRGLMTNPKLLLLDEPSLGLSPVMVQQIRQIISAINAAGTAVLLVEQNAQMALSIAHHGYILETGRVVLDQPAAQLLKDESVRKFYLGLHEGEENNRLSTLREHRTSRTWDL